MTKNEFLDLLRLTLSELEEQDIEQYLDYYAEMIEDRMEDGIPEEQAVAQVGDPIAIASEILWDKEKVQRDETAIQKEKKKQRVKRKLRAWEIVLLVLGSPLWISLLAAAAAIVLALMIVIFSVYLVLWSVVLVFWVCDLAIGLSAIAGICDSIALLLMGHLPQGLMLLGCSLVCGGIKIAWMFGCRYLTKYFWIFTKWSARRMFERRGSRR